MKNTSILIPIILIACLAALGFLFYKALQTVELDRGRGNNPIVLNEADYATDPVPDDVGAATDYDAGGEAELTARGDMAEKDYDADQLAADRDDTNQDDTDARVEKEARELREKETRLAEAARRARQEETNRISTPVKESSQNFNTAKEPSGNGRYLVIAGSFRQRANAQQRVNTLRKAGFKDTRLEKFNRGTYAVALAGQSNRYYEAERMASRLIAAGYEAKVMRRR